MDLLPAIAEAMESASAVHVAWWLEKIAVRLELADLTGRLTALQKVLACQLPIHDLTLGITYGGQFTACV